jgi:hypothetical protein
MFPSIFGPQVLPKSKGSGSAFQIYCHNYFGGWWSYPDRLQVDQRGCLLAQNVRFINRQFGTRYGFGPAFTYADSVANNFPVGMFNWTSELGNYLVWARGATGGSNALFLANISANPTPTVTSLPMSATTLGFSAPVFATAGPRLYVSQWCTNTNTASASTIATAGPAYVVTQTSGTFNIDKIIPGPPTNTQVPNGTFSEPTSGIVTAGVHSFGVRMQHRSGFLGRPGPDSSTTTNPTPQTFTPWTFTSSGGKNLQWTFTPSSPWPADVIGVQLVMNTVANPNQYLLVPGVTATVVGGAMTSVTFTVNIDDGSLVSGAAANDCTASLNWYTASATGQAYMQCAGVWNFGNRMFYLSQLPDPNGNNYWVVFASDPYEYQQISLDQHLIQLPNQLQIAGLFNYQGSIYLGGPHWTYYTQDNGQTPVNWMQPQLVDGLHGIAAPNCVQTAASGLYVWVADKTGLYQFTGSYPVLPISYNQTDKWLAQTFPSIYICMVDDPIGKRLILTAGPGFLGVWDYTAAIDPYFTRYAQFQMNNGLTTTSSATLVQNTLFSSVSIGLSLPEVWMVNSNFGSPSTYYFQREKNPTYDTNVYRDEGSSAGTQIINLRYDPPIFPVPGGEYDYLTHVGCKIRVTGSGGLIVLVSGFEGPSAATITLNPSISLAAGISGKQELRGYLVANNGFSYRIAQNTLDANCVVDEIDMYYSTYGSFL